MNPFEEFERKAFVVVSRKYANHEISGVCADFDAQKEAGLTLEECDELHRRMAEWNEPGSEPSCGCWFQDWYVFAYLRSRFLQPGEK